MHAQEIRRNTGSPSGDRLKGNSRDAGRAVWGDGEARSDRQPGNAGRGKGASVERNAKAAKDLGISDEPNDSTKCSEALYWVLRW